MTPTELADALDREADRGITELPNRIVDLLTQASHALRRLGADAATLTHRAEVAETVGRACLDLNRHFVGAEMVPKYHAIATRRLSQSSLPGMEVA